MSLTADALWLNTVFAGYDMAILSFLHKVAESAGAVLTPLFMLITLLGEKGIKTSLRAQGRLKLLTFSANGGKPSVPLQKTVFPSPPGT